MDIDPNLITLNDAVQRGLIRFKIRPSLPVARRWADPAKGVMVNGFRVVLRTVRIVDRLWTTAAWCREFERERRAVRAPIAPATVKAERGLGRRYEDAMRRLREKGAKV